MNDLTTTTDDHDVPGSVMIADGSKTGQIEITIEANAGDDDLECFELALGAITGGGSLDICQTTTTICIKDDAGKYLF